jgi:hypothetical protein
MSLLVVSFFFLENVFDNERSGFVPVIGRITFSAVPLIVHLLPSQMFLISKFIRWKSRRTFTTTKCGKTNFDEIFFKYTR